MHTANVSHVSIWAMPITDEFLWWIPRWKDSCQACGPLACFQPTARCDTITSALTSNDTSALTSTLKSDDPSAADSGTFDVTVYGADSTGVVPSDGPINSAISKLNQRGGGALLFPPGSYKVLEPLTPLLGNDIAVIGHGAHILWASKAEYACLLRFVGRSYTQIDLSADVTRGADSVLLTAALPEGASGTLLRLNR